MVLSELTNKELKGILQENDVKNYSNLNKKELVKKVNQLIKAQNGGKSRKGKNGKKKKYTLKDLIGGKDPEELKQPLLSNKNRINGTLSINRSEPGGYIPPSIKNIPITKNEINRAALQPQQPLSSAPSSNKSEKDDQVETRPSNVQVATEPPFIQSDQNALTTQAKNKRLNENQGGTKNECGICSIL